MTQGALWKEEAPQCSVKNVITDPDVVRCSRLTALHGYIVRAPPKRHRMVQLVTSRSLYHPDLGRMSGDEVQWLHGLLAAPLLTVFGLSGNDAKIHLDKLIPKGPSQTSKTGDIRFA